AAKCAAHVGGGLLDGQGWWPWPILPKLEQLRLAQPEQGHQRSAQHLGRRTVGHQAPVLRQSDDAIDDLDQLIGFMADDHYGLPEFSPQRADRRQYLLLPLRIELR